MTGLAPCFPCPSPESAEQGGWRQGAWHRAMKKSQEEVSRISCFLLCPVNDGAGATGAQHPGVGRQGGGPPARGPPGSSQPGSRTFAPQTPRAQLQGRGSVDPSPRAQEHHCTAIPLAGNSIFLQAPIKQWKIWWPRTCIPTWQQWRGCWLLPLQAGLVLSGCHAFSQVQGWTSSVPGGLCASPSQGWHT